MGLAGHRYEEGQTPLDPDEREGLLIHTVFSREDLNEVEQRNIEQAIRWIMDRRRRFTLDEVLSERFVLALHQRMFGVVWEWAGKLRSTDKNIGVDKYKIGTALRALLEDCRYWIDHETFSPDEISIRFKHRLVSIHCFANGNGRHARLMADILIEKIFGLPVFSWGSRNLIHNSSFRSDYLSALREADHGNISPLISFARS